MAKKASLAPKTPSEIEAEAARLEKAVSAKERALKRQSEMNAQEREVNGTEQFIEHEDEVGPQIPGYAERIANYLSDMDGGGSISVTRFDNGRELTVGEYDVSAWSPSKLDEIARECGGGTIQAAFRDAQGAYVGRIKRTFDPKFYSRPAAAPQDSTASTILQLQTLMMQQAQESKREMMDLFKTIITAQGNNRGSVIQSAEDLATLMKIIGPDKSAAINPIEMVKTILHSAADLKSLSAGRLDDDEEAGGKGFMEILAEKLLPVISAAVNARPIQQAPVSVPAIDAPRSLPAAMEWPLPPVAPVVGAAPAAAQGGVTPVENPMIQEEALNPILAFKQNAIVRMYAPVLVDMAQNNTDPELTAEAILQRIPNDYEAIASDIISRPDFFEVLCHYDPRMRPFKEWAFKVVTRLIDFLKEDQEEEAIPAGIAEPEAPAALATPAAPAAPAAPAVPVMENTNNGNSAGTESLTS